MDQQIEQLYGTWRLLSWTRTVVETGEFSEIFGQAPHGFLTFGRDGRVSSIVVRADRSRPVDLSNPTDRERVGLFNSMIAYAGTYKVEGNRVTYDVDISWNELWTGTDLVRHFQIEGSTLMIRSEPAVSPIDGKFCTASLIFEKITSGNVS